MPHLCIFLLFDLNIFGLIVFIKEQFIIEMVSGWKLTLVNELCDDGVGNGSDQHLLAMPGIEGNANCLLVYFYGLN